MAKKVTKRYLFPADYMADPSVHVFDGKIYIYPSHDRDSDAEDDDLGSEYDMKDYHVLTIEGPDPMSSPVVDHGNVLDVKDIPWASRHLWDCDAAKGKDGKYYLYFPAKDRNDVFHVGVAVSDSPSGPFVPQPDPIRGSYSIDMAVLEDKGEYYMYFGGIWGGQLQRYRDDIHLETPYLPEGEQEALAARCAKLSSDMLQWDGPSKPIVIVDADGKPLRADDPHRFFEASWVFVREGKYYFTYSTGVSHLLCYAVGDNPYGPFTYRGVILTPVVGWTTHHSIVEYGGKWWLFHHDSAPSNGVNRLRSLKVCELEFDERGDIQTIEGIDE